MSCHVLLASYVYFSSGTIVQEEEEEEEENGSICGSRENHFRVGMKITELGTIMNVLHVQVRSRIGYEC